MDFFCKTILFVKELFMLEKCTLDFEIRELDGHRIKAKINNSQWSKMLTDHRG